MSSGSPDHPGVPCTPSSSQPEPTVVPCPNCGGRIVVVGTVVGDALRLTAGGACADCGGSVFAASELEPAPR